MCWKATPKKEKRKWTHDSLYIGFHFFINPSETASNCFFFNSFESKWGKKNLAINMIKNLYYFVYCYNIQQQGTSDSAKKKTFIIANLFNKLYLFSNESASKSISVDMIWFSLESMASSCPSCFIFFSSPNHFITITLHALLSYCLMWLQAHRRYLHDEE